MAITAPLAPRCVSDAAVATGEAVTAQIGQSLAQLGNHLYEFTHDEACPGATSQTVPGHQHTGNGDGHSIPRQVYGHVWSLPIWASSDSASPLKYDLGTSGVGGVTYVSLQGLPNTHNTPGWIQRAAGSVTVDVDRYNVPCVVPIRLRAGCKGVKVVMWRGTVIGVDAAAATDVKWRVELRSFALGVGSPGTVLDGCEYTATASENAQWVEMPGTPPVGAVVNGEESGSTWLACMATAGARLDADTDFMVYFSIMPESDAIVADVNDGSMAFLYGAKIYEVMAE